MFKKILTLDRTILLLIIILATTLVLGLPLTSKNLIPNGLSVNSFGIGGLTHDQAEEELTQIYHNILNQEITLDFQGEKHNTSYRRMGFDFDSQATLENVNSIANQENPIKSFGAHISGFIKETNLKPEFSTDLNQLRAEVIRLYPDLKGPINAQIIVDANNQITINPNKSGLLTDFSTIEAQVLSFLQSDSASASIQTLKIEAQESQAEYTSEIAQKDAEKLKSLIGKEITFYFHECPEISHEIKSTIKADWLTIKYDQFIFNNQALENYLKNEIGPQFEKTASNAIIKELPAEGEIFATVEGIAKNGRELEIKKIADHIINGIPNANYNFELKHQVIPGKVINETGHNLGELNHISEGRSGFWGSGIGRSFNIRKGLDEKVNNILLAPGQEFSFVENLGTIDMNEGWALAYAIFRADELVPVPGGGLCQVSTTLYRAVLQANLEILEQSTHSLYIYYYEEFGNGLDAAVYPGSKDFRFRNNTDQHIFIQAYTEEDYGFVEIYGNIAEEVELVGPIYSGNVPAKYQGKLDPKWNEISWVKIVTHPDGTQEEEFISSKYKTAPRKMYKDP